MLNNSACVLIRYKSSHHMRLKHLALLVNRILILPITRSACFDAIALAEIDTDLLV